MRPSQYSLNLLLLDWYTKELSVCSEAANKIKETKGASATLRDIQTSMYTARGVCSSSAALMAVSDILPFANTRSVL